MTVEGGETTATATETATTTDEEAGGDQTEGGDTEDDGAGVGIIVALVALAAAFAGRRVVA